MNQKLIEEMEKCKASLFYFATNYITENGKAFTTNLTEEEFNKKFNELKNGTYNSTKKKL